jgi:O-acetylhomoserine (thiol)-lyase
MADRSWGFRTRALHAGGSPDPATGARAVPIYQTTSFVFDDTADAANLFALQKYGNIYSRLANPTVAAFEERMASLEGGIGAVAAASGLAAEFLTFAALAGAGDEIVSTTVTPWVCRPIEHGADIVVHSATKFLGGHGTTLGGVVVESGRFDWGNGRFPLMTEPVASYGGVRWWDNFGEYGFLTKLRSEQLRDVGASLSPMSAFLLLQGVETLPQRMDAHLANARTVAEWLEADDRVSYVRWAGLPSSPHHAMAARYTPSGPGAVFAFGVKGGRQAGQTFIESVELCSHLANIGDARTLVLHPGSTTHRQLTDAQLEAAGVPDDLVRISVGLEDVEDILWDLDQALAAATT